MIERIHSAGGIFKYRAPLIILFMIFIVTAKAAPASDTVGIYVAVGTSESIGFGVGEGKSYAEIVARECKLELKIVATIGATKAPTYRPLQHVQLISIFVSPSFADDRSNIRTNAGALESWISTPHTAGIARVASIPPT